MMNLLTKTLKDKRVNEIIVNKNKSCSILFDDDSVLSIGLIVDNEGPQLQIIAFGGQVVQWGDSTKLTNTEDEEHFHHSE